MMEVLSFTMEWFDRVACLTRSYLLQCFLDDTIEMYDLKNNKKFLKRTVVEGINRKSFYIGAMMTIFSRQMKVVAYGNAGTSKALEMANQRTMVLIKPDGVSKIGRIFDIMIENNLLVTKVRMVQMTKQHVLKFYSQFEGKACLPSLVAFLTSSPVVALELRGTNAVNKWRELMGPTDPEIARVHAPNSVRAKFGGDYMYNAVHGSNSPEVAEKELEQFFPTGDAPINSGALQLEPLRSTAVFRECTCVVIQPHAIREGMLGKIMMMIQDHGFEVSAMEMFNMTQANAMEFYEIYKGVVNDYMGMVEQMCSGPCLAMELRGYGPDTVKRFRCLAGFREVDAAKALQPNSIRAKYGHSNLENGVHCTALSVDGEVDSGYFFRLLQMKA